MHNLDFFIKGSGTPPHFEYDFQEKYFSCYILLTDQISLPGCLCFVRYWETRGSWETQFVMP